MSPLTCGRNAALALCLAVSAAAAQSVATPGAGASVDPPDAPAARAMPAPMPLTTDTPEYCIRLAAEVQSYGTPTEEARHLLAEGLRMCGNGHVIGGLMRLRRAFVIMQLQSGSEIP